MEWTRQILTYLSLALITSAACLLVLDARSSAMSDEEAIAWESYRSIPGSQPETDTPISNDVNELLADLSGRVETEDMLKSQPAEQPANSPQSNSAPIVAPPNSDPSSQVDVAQDHHVVQLPSSGDAVTTIELASLNHNEPTQTVLERGPTINCPEAVPAGQFPVSTSPVSLTPAVIDTISAHIEYGQTLARRGAFHSARSEFVQALLAIARALDGAEQSPMRSQALARALTAIKESQDFMIADNASASPKSVRELAAGHATKVVLDGEQATVPHVIAFHRYVIYALEQFRLASGKSPHAAEAFYSLGKLITLMSEHGQAHVLTARTHALAMHQLALDCNPQHYRSANELGVLFAWHGEWERAKQVLLQSLRVHQEPETWHNLAMVHRRLGELDLAERAQYECQLLAQSAADSPDGSDRWVSVSQFAAATESPEGWESQPSSKTRRPLARPVTADVSSFAWPSTSRNR